VSGPFKAARMRVNRSAIIHQEDRLAFVHDFFNSTKKTAAPPGIDSTPARPPMRSTPFLTMARRRLCPRTYRLRVGEQAKNLALKAGRDARAVVLNEDLYRRQGRTSPVCALVRFAEICFFCPNTNIVAARPARQISAHAKQIEYYLSTGFASCAKRGRPRPALLDERVLFS